MAARGEAGSEGVKDLGLKLKLELDILSDEADAQLRTYFTGVENSDAQLEALVVAHCFGVMMIHRLVEIVLGMLAAPSRFSQLDGKVEGLSLLLLSVAEIKRCAQSGRCCMWSTSELLDSDGGNGSLSRMRFFRLRELFFSVDLARVVFVIIMLEAKIHLDESWGSSSHSRNDIEEEFCNRSAHNLFEWCERRRRPVLKQRALDFEQEIMQHIALNEPALSPWPGFFSSSNLWSGERGTEWVQPNAEPTDSMPSEIDFNDLHVDENCLGPGSVGTIFRCHWHGRVAAMKIIWLAPEEPELQRRIERKFSILSSLQHPNVVPVFGFGYIKNTAEGFFLMEHMQTDLRDVIRLRRNRRGESRVFRLDVAVDIMSQIVEGMCELRLQRVIHRNLKPATILVNQRDASMGTFEGFYDVKLGGFACSNVQDDLDSGFRTPRIGTPAYMAPEVMSSNLLTERNGEYGYSWKADVYSFGMVCAEILSGQPPFGHLGHLHGIPQIFPAVRDGKRPELRLDGGDPLRRLIEDCWKFNAEERPDFGEVRRRLWECRVYHFFTAGAPSRFSQLDGKVEGPSLLLSVAEIKRCAQSERCCMSSTSELLDSEEGDISLSRMRFFRLRERFLSLDLARVTFITIMVEAKIHLDESWGSSSHSRHDIEEEFCNRQAHELFEWCERRRRPVLKQRTLDLGQEITQHIASNELALPLMTVFSKLDIWAADFASELEEPGAEPRISLPLATNIKVVNVEALLGQGVFGDVFQCRWRGRSAAMKIIKLDPEEPELERRFEMEVSILASLQHPNTVPVFGFGYTEGKARGFIVMEHMQTDLRNVIRERRERRGECRVFPLDVAVDIMSQIVEGMCALRRARVIHRDLKPANILVNQRDASMGALEGFYDVKLADFGCSKVRDDLDSIFNTLKMGTPAYMAPEVMSAEVMSGTSLLERNSEHGYSWKADVYSFAMVCAEILSGEPPFRHLGGMAKILAAVRDGERPKLRLDGGDALRRLIEDCWKFNAEERPDFEEVRRRLWECRVYHFFGAEEGSTSCDSEDSTTEGDVKSSSSSKDEMKGEQAAMEMNDSRSPLLLLGFAYKVWNAVSRWMARRVTS